MSSITANPRFDAVLYPNKPMDGRILVGVLSLLVLVSFVSAAVFAIIGAWPVSGFLGADIVGLVFALWWTRRQSRTKERIIVTHDHVELECASPKGECRRIRFELEDLTIRSSGRGLIIGKGSQTVTIGKFLTEDETKELGEAVTRAVGNKMRRKE